MIRLEYFILAYVYASSLLLEVKSFVHRGIGDATQPLIIDGLQSGRFRGYPLQVRGWDVASKEYRAFEAGESVLEHSFSPVRDGSAPSRVIYFDLHKEGLDDRMWRIGQMVSIAYAARAAAVTVPPKEALSHGTIEDKAADWWDGYFTVEPDIYRAADVKCAAGVNKTLVDPDDIPDDVVLDIRDSDRPLCLGFTSDFEYVLSNPPNLMNQLLIEGHDAVRFWTSKKVTDLSDAIVAALKTQSSGYNAMHIRIFEFRQDGCKFCTNSSNIAGTIQQLDKQKPVSKNHPWLVMSNFGAEYLAAIRSATQALGDSVVTEDEIEPLRGVEDNNLQYSALKCVFNAAELRVATRKNLGALECKSNSQNSDNVWLNCGTGEIGTEKQWRQNSGDKTSIPGAPLGGREQRWPSSARGISLIDQILCSLFFIAFLSYTSATAN